MNLSNPYHKKAWEELAEKRRLNEYKKHENYLLALQSPEFSALESEYKQLVLNSAKLEDAGKTDSVLTKKIIQLDAQKNVMLKKLGINLEDTSSCKNCNDTGTIKSSELCPCFKNRVIELMVKASGIPMEGIRKFSDCDFSVFENDAEIKKIYSVAENIVKNISTTKYKNVIVCGNAGSGKTFLFSCMAGELIAKGLSVFFTTAFNMNNMLLKYHTDFTASRVKYLDPFLESDVLIIDDLGTEQILKNVTLEYFLSIIKERENNGKHIFINTNLSPEEILDKYEERIFSRLFNKSKALIINMNTVKNLRLKK